MGCLCSDCTRLVCIVALYFMQCKTYSATLAFPFLPSPPTTMARPTGPKGAKSSALSLRLTPRTRYGLTLLARVNRLSLGQVVDEALERAFYGDGPGTLDRPLSGTNGRVRVLDATWDERPWVRLGKLALMGPELLTAPEMRLWSTIHSTKAYWVSQPLHSNPERIAAALAHDTLEADWEQLSRDAEVGI